MTQLAFLRRFVRSYQAFGTPCSSLSGSFHPSSSSQDVSSSNSSCGSGSSSFGSSRSCSSSSSSSSRGAQALAAVYAQTGDPMEVLQLQKLDVEAPTEEEIEVNFILAPINPADVNTVEGKYPLSPALPGVPGHEGVGVISKVGSMVKGLSPGDWVVPLVPAQGTWRTHGIFKASAFHKVPNTMHPEAAAALCINPPTALLMLEEFVKLREGDVIVQNGANSAVGQMVIQLARSMGVRTVNIVREREDWDQTVENLMAQGADVVTTETDARQNAKAAGLKGAVLGLNCVGGSSALTVAKLLKQGGTHVTYGGMSLEPVTIPTGLLMFKDLTLRGFWLSGKWAMEAGQKGKAQMIDRIVELSQKGSLKIEATSSKIYPLSDLQKALEYTITEMRGHKVLLKP